MKRAITVKAIGATNNKPARFSVSNQVIALRVSNSSPRRIERKFYPYDECEDKSAGSDLSPSDVAMKLFCEECGVRGKYVKGSLDKDTTVYVDVSDQQQIAV